LCQQAEETSDHLLLNCNYSKEVWKLAVGLQKELPLPQDIHSLLLCWTKLYPFQPKKQSVASRLWQAIPRFILWGLWLERNNRIFREKERRAPIVSARIRSLFGEWASAHRQSNYSREMEEQEELWRDQFQIQQQIGSKAKATTQEHWEIRTEKSEFDNWKRERKIHILSFDGASKGNPGQAGGGGIIVKPNAEVMVRYAIWSGHRHQQPCRSNGTLARPVPIQKQWNLKLDYHRRLPPVNPSYSPL
jgi:hypothetical protein